jgi:hypothetical protein
VVSLAAAAVIENRLAAELVAHLREARGDLGDGGVPADFLERAVGPAAQRLRQAVFRVLVVVEAVGLLAGVAARGRVGLVAAQQREVGIAFAAELHFEATVALAEDARGRTPG